MVQLPKLNLDLSKNDSFNLTKLKLRQNDKGYILPFKLTENWKDITVNANNLGFRAIKPDQKLIDVHGQDFNQNQDGTWFFKLPVELTQLATPALNAHIYVKNGDDIYTSSSFTFLIEPQFGENSSVSAEEITAINHLLESANALDSELRRLIGQYQTKANEAIQNANSAVDKIGVDGQTAINNVKADSDNAIKSIKDSYESLKRELTKKFNEFIDTNQNTFNSKIESWQSKVDQLKNTIKTINESANSITAKINEIKATDLANLVASVNTIKKKIEELNSSTSIVNLETRTANLETKIENLSDFKMKYYKPIIETIDDRVTLKIMNGNIQYHNDEQNEIHFVGAIRICLSIKENIYEKKNLKLISIKFVNSKNGSDFLGNDFKGQNLFEESFYQNFEGFIVNPEKNSVIEIEGYSQEMYHKISIDKSVLFDNVYTRYLNKGEVYFTLNFFA